MPVTDNPNCYVIHAKGAARPTVLFWQPRDYWHLPAAAPTAYWAERCEVIAIADPAEHRDDVLEMVFTLRIEDALTQLRRAYPTDYPQISDFAVDAPSDYPDGGSEGYTLIQRDFIDPIDRAYGLVLRLSIAIANQFGAHG